MTRALRSSSHALGIAARPGLFLAVPPVFVSPLSTPSPPDIRGIVPAQAYSIPGFNLLWPAAGLLALLLAGWALWHFLLRPRAGASAPGPSPRDIAAQRLRELEQRVDSLDPRLFGVEVSDVLRAYIGAQFGLQAQRQTSPEFLSTIVHASAFSAVEKAFLSGFLELSDLLKFAGEDASADARRTLLTQAREFVQPTSSPPPSWEALSAAT
jgi:hypothetical protein